MAIRVYWIYEKVLVSMICRKSIQTIVHALIEKQRLSCLDPAKDLNISDKAIYRHKAEIQENDNIDIMEILLNMTPEERCQLVINRNTLWYIKKNLKWGKKIKIYGKVKTKLSRYIIGKASLTGYNRYFTGKLSANASKL